MRNHRRNSTFIVVMMVMLAFIASITAYLILNKSEDENFSEDIENLTSVSNNTEQNASSIEINETVAPNEYSLVIFHNETGPMCVEAIEFFNENDIKFTEHLTTDEDFQENYLNTRINLMESVKGFQRVLVIIQ